MSGTVWITGASSGIGRALALRLARDGRRVVASARGAAALESLAAEAGPNLTALPLDTTDAAACENAVAWIETETGPLGLVVLNAGTHEATPASEFAVAPFRRLVEINLMGTVNALAPVLAAMRARRQGHIAVVASVAGYGGLPTAAAYGATKAALINMCEALKPECDALGVKLQLVDPGFVRTPLTDRNPFPMPFLMELDAAVDRFVAGLASDRFEIVFPRRFAALLKFLNMLPYALYFRVVKRITGRMSDVLDAYVAFFEGLRRDALDGLDALVTPDVRFRDPFNDVVGAAAMKKALDAAFDHGTPKFKVTDRARGARGAYLLWHFSNGAGFEIEGMSEIRFAPDGRVAAHLDHWDLGTQFYLRLPVIGRLVALVRNRLRVRA